MEVRPARKLVSLGLGERAVEIREILSPAAPACCCGRRRDAAWRRLAFLQKILKKNEGERFKSCCEGLKGKGFVKGMI